MAGDPIAGGPTDLRETSDIILRIICLVFSIHLIMLYTIEIFIKVSYIIITIP
jgi:hypothetical protein